MSHGMQEGEVEEIRHGRASPAPVSAVRTGVARVPANCEDAADDGPKVVTQYYETGIGAGSGEVKFALKIFGPFYTSRGADPQVAGSNPGCRDCIFEGGVRSPLMSPGTQPSQPALERSPAMSPPPMTTQPQSSMGSPVEVVSPQGTRVGYSFDSDEVSGCGWTFTFLPITDGFSEPRLLIYKFSFGAMKRGRHPASRRVRIHERRHYLRMSLLCR
ncbi:hypothetical protein HPB51_000318 [Rhipicephalus microplus]|uniref:Uncharacterized protein n=1 Tax=Rhipicephalus microplus TaxID=6941 RepID=A0A9J6EKN8_RHIMP|nr:hypothetical protein HPB51_000318 [Rhipicephalus microplus]